MPTTKLEDVNISILDALVLTNIAPSKGQAKTLIAQGGISLNDEKFNKIYETESEIISVSPGNNQNKQEFFATIGEEYFCNQEDLLKNSKPSYQYINNILDSN